MSTWSDCYANIHFTFTKLSEAEKKSRISYIRKTEPDYMLELSGLEAKLDLYSETFPDDANNITIPFPEPLDCSFFLNYGDLFLCAINSLETKEFFDSCYLSFFHKALQSKNTCNEIIAQHFKDHSISKQQISNKILEVNREYIRASLALAFCSLLELVFYEDVRGDGLFSAALQTLLSDSDFEYGAIEADQLKRNLSNKNLFSKITMTVQYWPDRTEDYSFQSLFDLIGFEVRQLEDSGSCIKCCENCGRLFIPANRSDEKYCDFLFKGDKTCKQAAFEIQLEKDAALKEYRRIYKMQNARKQRNSHNPHIAEYFDLWKTTAKLKLDECRNGYLTVEEMTSLLSSTDWMSGKQNITDIKRATSKGRRNPNAKKE